MWPAEKDFGPDEWPASSLTDAGKVSDLIPADFAWVVRIGLVQDWLTLPYDPQGVSLWSLRDILSIRTGSPEKCYVGFWEGGPLENVGKAQRLLIPNNVMYLYCLPLRRLEHICVALSNPLQPVEPSIWWPSDRRWFAHWDYDSDSLYVGADEDTADALLSLKGWPTSLAKRDEAISIESPQ